jgi:hypothetical protein
VKGGENNGGKKGEWERKREREKGYLCERGRKRMKQGTPGERRDNMKGRYMEGQWDKGRMEKRQRGKLGKKGEWERDRVGTLGRRRDEKETGRDT